MIVITGATGALNGATVEHLLSRVPAAELAVSVRDVAKAQHSPTAACGSGPARTTTRPPCATH